MSLTTLINRPCTILQRNPSAEKDDYGAELPDERELPTVCEVQQDRRAERGDEGELSDTQWVGFFLAGTELNTGDAVIVDGLGRFELVGDPWAARNPRTQIESHIEATLRRTAGPESGS